VEYKELIYPRPLGEGKGEGNRSDKFALTSILSQRARKQRRKSIGRRRLNRFERWLNQGCGAAGGIWLA